MSFIRPLAVVLAVAVFTTARADIINVGPGDSIQDAIDIALAGDEIVVAPGTYFENIDLLGKAVTVRSSGGAAVTTIDAQGVAQPPTPAHRVARRADRVRRVAWARVRASNANPFWY